jgi:hypothetical protein
MPKWKFPAVTATALALAATPVALAGGGATVKTTPTRASTGQTIEMLVKGMKPGEKVKGKESAPFGQTRTIYAKRPANHAGAIIFSVRAQVHGTHKWVFTGRSSHRTASTKYYVR